MTVIATPSGNSRALLCVAITTGEPAGVGPELTVAALAEAATRWPDVRFVVLGDRALLAARARCAQPVQSTSCHAPLFQDSHPNPIRIEHVPLAVPARAGRPDAANGRYVLALLDRAIDGALAGEFDAIVTAPLQKSTLNDAGVPFSGHTEYLAARTGAARVVMMLAGRAGDGSGARFDGYSGVNASTHSGADRSDCSANGGAHSGVNAGAHMDASANVGANINTVSVNPDANSSAHARAPCAFPDTFSGASCACAGTSSSARPLRVALATTHLPLKDVPAALTIEGLVQTLCIIDHDLRAHFGVTRPRILVTGLNPHAGENGYLGREEIDVIAPALAAAAAQGIDARGPYPADTLFQPRYLADADCVLAMFHDQGLPVLKYASFGAGINVTLGLPIVRTSVDHGTALDLAGTGRADAGSLIAAIDAAVLMARHRAAAA